jgi:predicted nucleotidyltransferase
MNNLESISHPDVRAFLEKFLLQVRAVLKQELVGMYLYGSLALGDFDPTSSDLDILIATTSNLPSETIEALRIMHENIEHDRSGWGKRLEVSYTPAQALRRYDQNNNRFPHISTVSPLGIIEHGRDWIINRYMVREKGIIVAGPSPQTLIAPISEAELKRAVRYILCNSWTQHVSGPEWMRPRKYQAFTVLTMCRAWYVLKKGAIGSKLQAAAWAQKELAPQWKPLIKRALLQRADPQTDDMTETLSFLRYTVEALC